MNSLKKIRIFNSNTIKLIAAVLMFIDHLGLLFFPEKLWLRIIGRLSMPIFAFAISEGCRYTKNKIKYFSMIFVLGILCQIVYIIVDPYTFYLGILLTFSLSILLIYAMQFAKKKIFDAESSILIKIGAIALFVALLIGTIVFCQYITIDYGIYGCLLPVFASIFDFHRIPAPDKLKKLDVLPLRILCLIIPLIGLILTHAFNKISVYSLLSIPLLLLYNGERGKRNMKYFFYIFYPLHLGILGGLQMLLAVL